jgi:hypothetical protein
VVQAIAESSARLARRLLATSFHKVDRPHLRAFFDAGPVFFRAEEFLAVVAGAGTHELERFREEHVVLLEEIERRRRDVSLIFPEDFGSGDEMSFVLYSLLRLHQPQRVLETGVADGVSTFFRLNAIAKNGTGTVHSVEVDENVGSLLSEGERHAWNLHVIPAASPRAFNEVVARVAPDFFFHDSTHLYYWAHFEYKTVREQLGERCFMTSDDVDKSFASLDFCSTEPVTPAFLLDRWKLFGVALPQSEQPSGSSVA